MKKVADSHGTEQKEKILPLVGQLEQEITNAQMRVEQLESECPSDWSPAMYFVKTSTAPFMAAYAPQYLHC
jgi:hypothetical protein